MKKNLLIILILIVTLLITYAALELLVPAQTNDQYIEVEIPHGSTFRQAVEILSKEKLIRDKNIFLVLGRLTGAHRKISAGFYSIWGSMSPLDIFRALRNGQIIEYNVTILEGDSIFEIADKFYKIGLISKADFIELSEDPYFLTLHGIESNSFEGYIYPDTYKIPKGVDAEEAVSLMINRMREKYSGKLRERTVELGMTENEVLTLASIIEKEAVVDTERPLISAVYHNRLKKNMKLQADPTSVYGIKNSGQKITKSDLLRKTPYNTYNINGLPPGPIASPGLKSIIAALYPADVKYLYFVSKDDMTHHFSKTAKEHLEAVKLYRGMKEKLKDNTIEEQGKDETS